MCSLFSDIKYIYIVVQSSLSLFPKFSLAFQTENPHLFNDEFPMSPSPLTLAVIILLSAFIKLIILGVSYKQSYTVFA